jgi:small conductance mechanosensitive channel
VIAAFGAATGLALSGTLQNFASGVLILLLKPFDTGDNIVAQGVEGTVTSIRIFYTIITTFDNRTVIMPNSKLSNEVIVNITHQGVRRLDIELKFKNTEPIETVKAFLTKVFAESREVLHEPAIRIGVSAIEEDSYKITCNIWINAHGFEDTRMMINEKIVSALSQRFATVKDNNSLLKED